LEQLYLKGLSTNIVQFDFIFNFLNEVYFESSLKLNPGKGIFDTNIFIYRLYLDAFSDFLKKSVQLDSISGVLSSNIYSL